MFRSLPAPWNRTFLACLLGVALCSLDAARLVAQQPPQWADDLLGQGEESPDGQAAEQPTADQLKVERANLDEEIAELRARLRQESATDATSQDAPPPASETSAAAQLRWLEKTRSLLGQQLDELRRAESLATAEDDLAAKREAGVAGLVDQRAPFGFAALDSVLTRLEAATERAGVLADAVAAGAESLEQSERRLRRAQQEQRSLRERLDAASIGERAGLDLQLQLGTRIERAAEEELGALRLQTTNDRRELALVERRREFLAEGVRWLRHELQPAEDELAARLQQLADRQDEVRGRMVATGGELEQAQTRLLRAEREAGEAADTSPEVARRQEAVELLERRQRLLEDHADRIDTVSALWRTRQRLASRPLPAAAERQEMTAELRSEVADLERQARLLEAAADGLRSRAAQLGGGQDAGQDAADRRSRLAGQLEFLDAEHADAERALTLARRVLAEASEESLGAGELASLGWHRVVNLWNRTITTVDERPITLGKVFIALLLLIAGYVASKRISHSLGRLLQQRFGVSGGGAAALQNIAFYLMVVAFLLWAMRLVSIPLTVFTLLGGVLAIGIGFGSQNVVNNFISGLILLVERPVKVGDLVEVDGTVGVVEQIGLRSARVRSGDNTHVIVPNSTFLEQKVLNWTVTDDLVRTHVDVGIAYGSPTREAAKLMEQALADEAVVVQNMPKEVMFMEFGDNALLMRAYFWIHVHGLLDTLRAQSHLRFRIDDMFREADITIAFPQRDVHLDTLSPLEVRVTSAGDGEPKAKIPPSPPLSKGGTKAPEPRQ